MLIYFHADGSQTISRLKRREHGLSQDSDRIVEVTEDGSVIVRKDRFGGVCGRLLAPLPSVRAGVPA